MTLGKYILTLSTVVILVLNLGTGEAKAANFYWPAITGDWSTPDNWGGIEPTSSDGAIIANEGTATITQTGEVCNGLEIGDAHTGMSGMVLMTAGSLDTNWTMVGISSPGVFDQSGGIHSVGYDLCIGCFNSSGTYNLSGNAQLSVNQCEFIGDYQGSSYGIGEFKQSGGMNTTPYLCIGPTSRYDLTGGTLEINGGFQNENILDCGGGNSTIDIAANSVVNLSKGSILNAKNTSLNIGADSLLIIAPDFDPVSVFKSYTNAGKTHILGTTFNIAEGETFQSYTDIDDFVECQGTIHAPLNLQINLNGGLSLSPTGNVDLGASTIRTDVISKMYGGILRANRHFIGIEKGGSFTQSAGDNHTDYLIIGQSAKGTYNLEGTGSLSTDDVYVGVDGMGTLNISSGVFSAFNEMTVGFFVPGIINQSGGTVTIGEGESMGLNLGYINSGTYNLTGGTLKVL
jgi:T5SS/PEP-CTERM-associated repeat protein